MNKAQVWSLLNECTKLFVARGYTQEELEAFIQERNEMMLAATGEPYYAWYIG